jgi:hypothetical protein
MERCPFYELHGNVKNTLVFAGIVYGDNVGVVQQARGPGFILKAPEHVFCFQAMDIEPHGLEGNGSPNGRIQRLIYQTHGATPKLFDNFVSSYFLEGHLRVLSYDSMALDLVLGETN